MQVKIVRLLLLLWVFPILASCGKSEPFAAKTPKPAISAAPAQAKANLTPSLAVSTALPTSLPLTATPAPTIKETSTNARPYAIAPESLAWDNASRWLAYISSQSASGSDDLNLLTKGGSEPMVLTPRPWPEEAGWVNLAWSPSGEALLVYGFWGQSTTGAWLLAISDTAFGQVQPLVESQPANQDTAITSMSWSNDGQRIAYTLGGEAWVYRVNTRQAEQVTRITGKPIQRPMDSELPFNGVRRVAFSPDGRYLGLDLRCNCPSPWNGVGVVDLRTRKAQLLVDGAELLAWSHMKDALAIRNITGDGSIDYTYDAYQVNVENGELVNLSRSNPAFDTLIDGFQKFKLNPGYQNYGFTWDQQGLYLYRTRNYHNRKEGEGPTLGFIARDAAGKIIEDRQPTAERWSVYPSWLWNGRLAWIDVIPGYPYPNNEYAFRMQAVIIDHTPVLKQDLTIEWPAWAPDGSILAYVVRSKGPNSAPDTIQWLNLR